MVKSCENNRWKKKAKHISLHVENENETLSITHEMLFIMIV